MTWTQKAPIHRIALLLLLFVTCLVYVQMTEHDFISLDDPVVLDNELISRGVSWEGIVWSIRNTSYYDYWHPLSWLSHMVDFELYGQNAGGHHLSALIIHLLAVVSLYAALSRLTRRPWPSLAVAALFAVHPVHVESVAWVVERKDVLSGLFFFLTLLSYSTYVKQRRAAPYALTCALYVVGLSAKPMLVTLPFVLLLLDYWPLGRLKNAHDMRSLAKKSGALLLEKTPLFVCAFAAAVFTYVTVAGKGIIHRLDDITLVTRLSNAVVSYVRYLGHLVFPTNLALLYPYETSIDTLHVVGASALLILLLVFSLWRLKQEPYLIVGLLWFLGMLVPVIGLVQTGQQSMADRFLYIPAVGIYMAAAFAFADRLPVHAKPAMTKGAIGIFITVIALYALGTFKYLGHWRNSESIYRHTISVTERNYSILNNLAVLLVKNGELEEAQTLLQSAVEAAPYHVDPIHNYGVFLLEQGEYDSAIVALKRAVQLSPTFTASHIALARGFRILDKDSLSARHALAAVENKPRSWRPWYQAANELLALGAVDQARDLYLEARAMAPFAWQPRARLGLLEMKHGSIGEALIYFKEALSLSPHSAMPYVNAGLAMLKVGMIDEAIELFERAEQLAPSHCNVLAGLMVAYGAKGRIDSVSNLTERAYRTGCDSALVYEATQKALRAEWSTEAIGTGNGQNGN